MTPGFRYAALATLALATSCNSEEPAPEPALLERVDGNEQTADINTLLPLPLRVRVLDEAGAPVQGVSVAWEVTEGGGSITATSTTNVDGTASATFTLGSLVGTQHARAIVDGLAGSPVAFSATAIDPGGGGALGMVVRSGGNNVPERFTSDLWLHGSFAYTGTWAFRQQQGNVVKVWQLSGSGAPALANTVSITGVGTVSDVEVTSDGQILLATTENGTAAANGMHLFSLTNPAAPSPLGNLSIPGGFHTGTFATIGAVRYVFGARNPSGSAEPALVIVNISNPALPAVVATVPVPRDYGIHDTFVRDGIAFVFAWNTGVILYDVGNGMKGGSPSAPVEISRLVTATNGVTGGPQVHNGWWFHNPETGEKRYLFIGQEGPGSVGGFASSGDIHVVDVSNLESPVEVASFRLPGAGVHNFWMDEGRQILYAAFYNGGVAALDVSGTLTGDLSNRLLGTIRPGGPSNTFVWGVMLHQGSLYASDMHSGLWQLAPTP